MEADEEVGFRLNVSCQSSLITFPQDRHVEAIGSVELIQHFQHLFLSRTDVAHPKEKHVG